MTTPWPKALKDLEVLEVVKDGLLLCRSAEIGMPYLQEVLRGRPSEKFQKAKDQVCSEINKVKCLQSVIDECEAAEVYEELEVPFLRSKLYEDSGCLILLTEWKLGGKWGKDYADWKNSIQSLRSGFVADALLANYEVFGKNFGNILFDTNGYPWRTRSGGFLHASRCRVCGRPEPVCGTLETSRAPEFCPHPLALWDMRDPDANPELAAVFGSVGIFEIQRQIRWIGTSPTCSSTSGINSIVDGRCRNLKVIGEFAKQLEEDDWRDFVEHKRGEPVPGHADQLLRHMMGIRHCGISTMLDQDLVADVGDAYLLKTAEGRPFGTLRGRKSAVSALVRYAENVFEMAASDIIDWIVSFAQGVKISSWDRRVQITKHYFVNQRKADPNSYFWGEENCRDYSSADFRPSSYQNSLRVLTQALAERFYQFIGRPEEAWKVVGHACALWHGFVIEVLLHTRFRGNNQSTMTVTVVRTEAAVAVDYFQIKSSGLPCKTASTGAIAGDVDLVGTRGALESSSIYTLKFIHGNIVTEQHVPYIRCFSFYMIAQPKSVEDSLSFYENDTENELSFLPHGLTFQIRDKTPLKIAQMKKEEKKGEKASDFHW